MANARAKERFQISRLLIWLPALAWMALIVFFAGQNGTESARLSLRVAAFISRLLGGRMSPDSIHFLIRKLAHFGIFAVEGFLMTLALRNNLRGRRGAAGIAALLCAVMAAGNEYQQSFSVGRGPSPVDACIDLAGALLGIAVCSALLGLIGWAQNKKTTKLHAGNP